MPPVNEQAQPAFPMVRFTLRFPALFPLLLAGCLLVPGLRAADWKTLTTNSPFGQAGQPGPETAPNDLEFRGVVVESGVQFINLYDPATKKAQWVPVNGQVPGLEVRSYDAGAEKVQIAQAGRALTLPLKQARVTLAQSAPPPAEPAQGGENASGENRNREDRRAEVRAARQEGAGNPGGPMLRNLPPEAQAMIDEFRRRRAERAGNQQNAPQGAVVRQRPQPQQQP